MVEPSDAVKLLVASMNQGSPQAMALGIETLEVGEGRSLLRIPYKPEMIGDPETRVIAGGVVTTLLDHACGQAVFSALQVWTSIATLDLRIDYMRPAEPDQPLFAAAHCYKFGRQVAFVRATAYERSADDPVATAQAAFMLNSSAGKPIGANLRPRA